MTQSNSFTIESFYKYIKEGELKVSRCVECCTSMLPPRPICPKCLSEKMEWVKLKGKGKIKTFTVIHVAPKEFRSQIPYIISIVELEEGLNITGRVIGISPEKVKFGMEVELDFKTPQKENVSGRPCFIFKPI